VNVALRCYIDNKVSTRKDDPAYYNENLVFVFDTETTVDQYQNLKFGSYGIWENGKLYEFGLFYDNNLDNNDVKTLSDYADKKHIKLITKSQFLDLFIDYVYKRRAICVGFNLPFDISRIALDYSISRKDNNAFSFKLFDSVYMPRIIIKHIDSKRALINFSTPYSKNYKKANRYRGTFVDLRTLSFALTNENHSLESACELFNVKHKKLRTEAHGNDDTRNEVIEALRKNGVNI